MNLEPVAADTDGFRAALGSFASSVNVITLWDEDHTPLGMTATAFSSVSADPLLILICLNRESRTYAHIAERRTFGVNILGSYAQNISDYCARSGGDKDLNESWLSASPGWQNPALAGALAFLDCEVEQDIRAGTHAVLIGAVTGIGLNEYARIHEPLMYFKGQYRPFQPPINYSQPRPLPILLDELV